jgi:LysM repeat protein
MLSAIYTEAGAGVSCSGDYCYFTLDAAQPSGAPIVYTPPVGGTATSTSGGTAFPTRIVVFPNTPKPDGSVTHIVQPGETLFTISLAYKTTVDSLKSLNRLSSDLIYPGDTLIIFPPRPTETAAPTETETPVPTATPFVFRTATHPPEPTATPLPSAPLTGGSGGIVVGIIIVAALVVAGVLTAAGARPVRKREE